MTDEERLCIATSGSLPFALEWVSCAWVFRPRWVTNIFTWLFATSPLGFKALLGLMIAIIQLLKVRVLQAGCRLNRPVYISSSVPSQLPSSQGVHLELAADAERLRCREWSWMRPPTVITASSSEIWNLASRWAIRWMIIEPLYDIPSWYIITTGIPTIINHSVPL